MTDISGGKKSLLAQAARLARTDTGVGDVPRFLDAYYRHVAAEDLAEAGAERAAAVAMEQAAFAAHRPQGRPWSGCRPPGRPRWSRPGPPWTSSPTTCPTWWTRC